MRRPLLPPSGWIQTDQTFCESIVSVGMSGDRFSTITRNIPFKDFSFSIRSPCLRRKSVLLHIITYKVTYCQTYSKSAYQDRTRGELDITSDRALRASPSLHRGVSIYFRCQCVERSTSTAKKRPACYAGQRSFPGRQILAAETESDP